MKKIINLLITILLLPSIAFAWSTGWQGQGTTGFSNLSSSGSSSYGGSVYNFYNNAPVTNGLGSMVYFDDENVFPASAVTLGTLSYLKNTGSTIPAAGDHGVAMLGWSEDTVNGKFNLIGTEGRAQGHSATSGQFIEGVNGDAIWQDSVSGNSTTFAGSVFGGLFQTYIYAFDGSTARNQGTYYGAFIGTGVGGSVGYGLLVSPQGGGTSATVGVGEAIGAANYITLQVGYNSDPTTSAGGIGFGTSLDTLLYRNAASSLFTNGLFTANTIALTTDAHTGAALCTMPTTKVIGYCTTTPTSGLCTCATI